MKIKIDPKSPKKKFQEENVPKRPSKLGGKSEIFSGKFFQQWKNIIRDFRSKMIKIKTLL